MNQAYQQLRSTQQVANVAAKKKEDMLAKVNASMLAVRWASMPTHCCLVWQIDRLAEKKEYLEAEYGKRVANEDGTTPNVNGMSSMRSGECLGVAN